MQDWSIKHSTSSPRNPRSNGQAESALKIVKGLLTHAKCSGQDPYLALLAYRSTPVDSHLRSPSDVTGLKSTWLRTMVCLQTHLAAMGLSVTPAYIYFGWLWPVQARSDLV